MYSSENEHFDLKRGLAKNGLKTAYIIPDDFLTSKSGHGNASDFRKVTVLRCRWQDYYVEDLCEKSVTDISKLSPT